MFAGYQPWCTVWDEIWYFHTHTASRFIILYIDKLYGIPVDDQIESNSSIDNEFEI